MSWRMRLDGSWGRLGMKSGWNEISLGEIAHIKTGKLNSNAAVDGGKYPFFTCSPEVYRIDTYAFDEEAILLAGNNAEGNFNIKYFFGKFNAYQRTYVITAKNIEKCSLKYLYYALKLCLLQFKALAQGTSTKFLTVKILNSFYIALPSLQEQKRIADTLSLLDEKIELNQKINDNLQQQAQAIYTSIFIENADPQWKRGCLSDLVIVKYGKDHKKLANGTYPVFGSGGIMRYVDRSLYDRESILIPRKGTLNNVMYINQPFWSVDTMFYTEMRLPNVAKFVYHFVKVQDLASMNAGSAVPSMTTDILNAMEVDIPSALVLEEFERMVTPMYNAMQENNNQSSKLAEIRDTLLPKLMSGEIDVSIIQL